MRAACAPSQPEIADPCVNSSRRNGRRDMGMLRHHARESVSRLGNDPAAPTELRIQCRGSYRMCTGSFASTQSERLLAQELSGPDGQSAAVPDAEPTPRNSPMALRRCLPLPRWLELLPQPHQARQPERVRLPRHDRKLTAQTQRRRTGRNSHRTIPQVCRSTCGAKWRRHLQQDHSHTYPAKSQRAAGQDPAGPDFFDDLQPLRQASRIVAVC